MVCNNPVPVTREDGESVIKGNLLFLIIFIVLDSFKGHFNVTGFHISCIFRCPESNSGIRDMVLLKESNRFKIDYGKIHEILEILMYGSIGFFDIIMFKVFMDDYVIKIMC